jgi:hypothetical protein
MDNIVDHGIDYLFEPSQQKTIQIISYCQRTIRQSSYPYNLTKDVFKYTFADLHQQNVTSEDLFTWSSTSLDIIEQCQIYLDNITSSQSASSIFYNCSSGRFGAFCQYQFYLEGEDFGNIVYDIFDFIYLYNDIWSIPCYEHLQCNQSSSHTCLDWREVCNGIIDCMPGGVDEEYCYELEINECLDNEYRCHNGLCVPGDFYEDDALNPDCLDGSDEHDLGSNVFDGSIVCSYDPTFRCEERTCRRLLEFPCGDGDCIKMTVLTLHHDLSFCYNMRDFLWTRAIIREVENEPTYNFNCIFAIICLIHWDDVADLLCEDFTENELIDMLNNSCPQYFSFPRRPVMLGHVYFVYLANRTKFDAVAIPDIICYNQTLCPFLPSMLSLLDQSLKGLGCRYFVDLSLRIKSINTWLNLTKTVHELFRTCSLYIDVTKTCLEGMFRCNTSITSKCISNHRLQDGIIDCFQGTDEQFNNTCSLPHRQQRFPACQSKTDPQQQICLSPMKVHDNIDDCFDDKDEEAYSDRGQSLYPPFPRLCDLVPDMFPVRMSLIGNGQDETDETNCPQSWPCNNIYTRCDGIWNCLNGADELNCNDHQWPCPSDHHPCVKLYTNEFDCLPVSKAGDNIIDCRGATDERHFCRVKYPYSNNERYHCSNDTTDNTCIYINDMCTSKTCTSADQEPYCKNILNNGVQKYCSLIENLTLSEKYLCSTLMKDGSFAYPQYRTILYLKLTNLSVSSNPVLPSVRRRQRRSTDNDDIENNIANCQRGIPARLIGESMNEITCFCPPAYYGSKCQYQNQRVSLTLQFRKQSAPMDWFDIFHIVVMLVDDQQTILSHDYISYVPTRDCSTKFNIYLLYSTRPKLATGNHSVHVHAFKKNDLPSYHVSWYLAIPFQFLPVNRLAVQLIIPNSTPHPAKDQCSLVCGENGYCMSYANQPDRYFCQCLSGWMGIYCNISNPCNCSSDSICVGHSSICICPRNKFGPRCYLSRSTPCTPKTCLNNGICVPADERISKTNFTCLCPKGFSGTTCELKDTCIEMKFQRELTIPPSTIIHFIYVRQGASHIQTTTAQKIALEDDSISIFTSNSFHIVFVEFSQNYYLTVLQENYIPSTIISTHIDPVKRCSHITELFENGFHHEHVIRRIKRYHEPCQQKINLACFHDRTYMCLCTEDRHANCFLFNFNTTYDCQGLNYCENGGQCFQDNPFCPRTSLCVCAECFFGTKCQFSTRGFSLSLDAILAYQIRSHIGISQQFLAVKISIFLTVLIFVTGFVNSCFSILTFRRKEPCQFGCGIYLFTSSIISIFIISMLSLKCSLLIVSQMSLLTNQSFLYVQCITIDGFLNTLLHINDLLSVSVSIERTLVVIKGVNFDKRKSKKIAKWIVFAIVILALATNTQDPLYRTLIHDDQEQRTWCVIRYPASIYIFNTIINIAYFLMSFISNFLSTAIIIITMARKRSVTHKNHPYIEHLREQLKQHKHLLITPCILVLLALPRLVISLLTGCMKSTREPWLFLAGYFVSFIPHILTFVVFILPSKIYLKEFFDAVKELRDNIRTI